MGKVKVQLRQLAREGLIDLFLKDFNLKVGVSKHDIRTLFLICEHVQEHFEEFYLHITKEQRKIFTPYICEFGTILKYRKDFRTRILQELTEEEVKKNFDFITNWRNPPTKPQWKGLMKRFPKVKEEVQAFLKKTYK